MSYSKKDEDAEGNLFANLDRTTVFQDARVFNQSPVSPRKCRVLLTKIIYILSIGEHFSTLESTDLFFGMTKLFQHKDPSLRQMVYIVMQELAKTAQDTIMITSSIIKDTSTTSETIYRPNAIRALVRIIDAGTIPTIERLMRTAIVDKTPAVSSAALVSSIHLFPLSKDIIRRWMDETSEVMISRTVGSVLAVPPNMTHLNMRPNPTHMCQYHGLGLLYQMRTHDRMGVVKMIQNYSAPPKTGGFFGAGNTPQIKSSWAVSLLVRYARQMIDDDPNLRGLMMGLLESWLKHKSPMVNLEAARAILSLPTITQVEANPALNTLQLFLTSPQYVHRFSAMRTLNRFSLRYPQMMHSLNTEIEPLVSDTNRSIATYAITTLLKTGSEESVERLMKTIQGFMADISDEFKIIVVSSIRALCLKFPSKQELTITFLSSMLRDEGGFEFKKAVVDALFDLIKYVDASKEEALSQLCEFIEDCEYSKLACRILYVLGREGPKAKEPSKYVRYIYNRVVLENAIVRAAAVNAMARFARVPGLEKSIKVLLKRCLSDPDDEVRDRAALSLRILEDPKVTQKYIQNEEIYLLPQLEKALVIYVQEDKFGNAFDISAIPIVTREEADSAAFASKQDVAGTEIAAPQTKEPTTKIVPEVAEFDSVLKSIANFDTYGELLKSSKLIELNEREMEYFVTAHIHIFKEHIVLQYDINNTLPDTILENISVVATPSDEDMFTEEFIIPAERSAANQPATVYVSFNRSQPYTVGEFMNMLKFTSKEVDPSTGEAEQDGYDDEYEVGTLEVGVGEYIQPLYISGFAGTFDSIGVANQSAETYALSSLGNLQEACDKVASVLSMQALEGSDIPMNPSTHTLKLAGKSVDGQRVLANVQMAYSAKNGVTLKISARSEDRKVAELVSGGIA